MFPGNKSFLHNMHLHSLKAYIHIYTTYICIYANIYIYIYIYIYICVIMYHCMNV